MAYYFNPQAHGNESLELFAQVVEKEGYTIGLQEISGNTCCRVDYAWSIGGIKIRGAPIWREDFMKMKIEDYIIPGDVIMLDVLTSITVTPFCCCESGCSIF